MLDYLVTHALKNVWCSPRQDRQVILDLSKVSAYGGARNHIDYMWVKEKLPTENQKYHIYAIGQNSPDRLNLDATKGVWFNFVDVCGRRNLIANVYTNNGLSFNPASVWVMRTAKGVYLIAIQTQSLAGVNLNTEKAFLRLYSNSFWGSLRSNELTSNIVVESIRVTNQAAALSFQNRFHALRDSGVGKAYAFNNGYLVKDFLPEDVPVGSDLFWVYDGSIRTTYDFKINTLNTFVSTLDNTRKYLLHPPKNLGTIDYQDDVDVFIVEKFSNGKEKGVYFHRNNVASLRMVTHQDYSLSVDSLAAYINDHPSWVGNTNLYIRLHVRNSGYVRPLVDEHQRIKELYKLTNSQIISAMIGLDSNVPEWKAASLEQSNYARIMRSYGEDVTAAEVIDAYGYNAIAKLIADTPNKIVDQTVKLPVGLQYESTIFEYDANGCLLDWRQHNSGEDYYTVFPETVLVEGLVGLGGLNPAFTVGTAPVLLDPLQSYKFYVSTVLNGTILQDWLDVTGNPEYYSIANGTLTWKIDPAGKVGAIKGNKHFICYDITLEDYDLTYQLSINHTPVQGIVLQIPPGRIDIFLNGKALQEGLDFVVDYPEVMITNKEYLNTDSGQQKFTIRCVGFSDANGGREVATEKGFVTQQLISLNSTYDLRDDKVKRIVVDGRTFHRDSLRFEENVSAVALPGIAEGRPYFIEDTIVPIRGAAEYNTFVLRQRSMDMDKKVSDYLASKVPVQSYPLQPMLPSKYQIFSPFLAKLIFDLSQGFLLPTAPEANEEAVRLRVRPYLDWLVYEPSLDDTLDMRFVSIHPHSKITVVSVNLDSFLFLERIIELYLRNRVELNSFVSVV